MIAIDTVDSAALTGVIRALRVIIEARKGELGTAAEAELQEQRGEGKFLRDRQPTAEAVGLW
jgi:hypothetical protein